MHQKYNEGVQAGKKQVKNQSATKIQFWCSLNLSVQELKSDKAKIGEMLVFKLEKEDLVKVFPNVGVQAGWCLRGKPPFPC